MKIITVPVFVLLFCAIASGCGSGGDGDTVQSDAGDIKMIPGQEALADGFYEILRELSSGEGVPEQNAGEQAVVSTVGPWPSFVVRNVPGVALRLATDPSPTYTEQGMTQIDMILVDEEAAKLEEFTRANVGRRVAIIVGGTVASMPEVRGVITGPESRIHCSGEPECKRIIELLRDNVEK